MIQARLLWALGYIWAIFGAYWIVFARGPRATRPGESRFYARSRLTALVITFALLLLLRDVLPPVAIITFGFIWAVLGLYWAAPAKAAQTGESTLYRLLRLVILAVTFSLLFWDRTAIGLLAKRLVPPFPAFAIIGFASATLGLAVALWARTHLGQYWSDKVVLNADHQLIQSGPYAYMRHPIYSGVLLGVAGTALLVGEWRGVLAFALLLTNYAIKAKKEERILRARFSDQFQEHMRHAGFLFPRFRARS
jgi:protein-S-isoprenylcysteine O-methyltransferase Ste14